MYKTINIECNGKKYSFDIDMTEENMEDLNKYGGKTYHMHGECVSEVVNYIPSYVPSFLIKPFCFLQSLFYFGNPFK